MNGSVITDMIFDLRAFTKAGRAHWLTVTCSTKPSGCANAKTAEG